MDLQRYEVHLLAQQCNLLSGFCNLMLSGKLVSHLWLRSRSVLVPKKDNTPRPLGIGDAWYRLVGRASLTKIGKRVGGALYPHQFGVAIKNGCEIGGRTAQMAFDAGENLGLLALDNDNKIQHHAARGNLHRIGRVCPRASRILPLCLSRSIPPFLPRGMGRRHGHRL